MVGVVFCLFDLILYVPSTIFQLYRDGSSWVEPVLSKNKCVLLKDNNAVTPVRLEPAALRSRVKHSTTEPVRSLCGWCCKGLTHLSQASFLWGIDRQCRTRSDAAKRGVWSGSVLFAYRMYCCNWNEIDIYYPSTL